MPKQFPLDAAIPPRDDAPTRATDAGTAAYAERFRKRFVADYFRQTTFGPSVSSVGLGTYLGEASATDDAAYESAVIRALNSGINLIDSAINYRNQRSERAIGAALRQAFATGALAREATVICSKGGYIPLDGATPANRDEYQAYIQREFLDTEIAVRQEIVAGGHCLAPRFLRFCLAKSRHNLAVKSLDVYYVHNPEQQLASVPGDELRTRLRAAFAMLEELSSRGEIGAYGCATWDGLRVPPGNRDHLSLEDLVAVARETAGDAHHFRAVQLPINLAMSEAVRVASQPLNGKLVTLLEAADALGVTVVGSAALMQGQLTRNLPTALHDAFPACSTDAQRAISFARTLPGVTAALVGMKRPEHVEENLGAARA